MIIVHHLNNSRSQRIIWGLEELGFPYEIRRYERDGKTMLAPQALRQVHPLGKSPVLEDEGHVLVESGAILDYLVRKAEGTLGPSGREDEKLRYDMFLHYAEGSVMPLLLVQLVLGRVPLFGKIAIRKMRPMLDVHLDFIERELARRPWFAGEEMTMADVMMSFPLEVARARAGLGDDRPHIGAWLKKIEARPAYQRALKAGGPYAYS